MASKGSQTDIYTRRQPAPGAAVSVFKVVKLQSLLLDVLKVIWYNGSGSLKIHKEQT